MRKLIFRGKTCYISECRIRPYEKKDDYHYYEIRHCDDDFSEPANIEDRVLVNFWGTIATKEPLTYEKEWAPDRFMIELTDDEANYLAKSALSDKDEKLINESEDALTYETVMSR